MLGAVLGAGRADAGQGPTLTLPAHQPALPRLLRLQAGDLYRELEGQGLSAAMLQGALSLGVQRCVQLAQCTLHGAHVLISRGRLARALAMHSAQAAAAAASAGSSAGGAAAMEEQEEQELYLLSLTLSTDFVPACLALACGGALLPGNAGMKLLLYLLGNAAANQLHQDSSGGGRSVTPATVVGPADGSPPQSVLAFGWTTATESSFAAIQGPVSFAGEARQVGSSDVCHARFSNGRVDFTCVGGHSSRAAPPVPQLPPGLAQRFMLLFARHGRRLLERPEGWLPTDRLRLSGRSGRGARMLRPELTEVDVLRELGCLPGTPDEAVFQAITKLNTPERLAVMAAVGGAGRRATEGCSVGGSSSTPRALHPGSHHYSCPPLAARTLGAGAGDV